MDLSSSWGPRARRGVHGESHVLAILRKLELRIQAVAFGYERGLVRPGGRSDAASVLHT